MMYAGPSGLYVVSDLNASVYVSSCSSVSRVLNVRNWPSLWWPSSQPSTPRSIDASKRVSTVREKELLLKPDVTPTKPAYVVES